MLCAYCFNYNLRYVEKAPKFRICFNVTKWLVFRTITDNYKLGLLFLFRRFLSIIILILLTSISKRVKNASLIQFDILGLIL